MKNKFLLFIACCAMTMSCSSDYDDSSLWDKVNDLDNRVSYLERLCEEMNTNISSMQGLITALEQNDHIVSVTPVMRDNVEIGYTITFKKSNPITVYHGMNGNDGADGNHGSTPIIGIKQHTDGVYYWTQKVGDGEPEWILDGSGNKIKATGTDGATPKLKIEDGYWYISTDNGTTWTNIGKATGEDGDAFFQNVIDGDDSVTFVLANGDTITIPKTKSVELRFENPRNFATGETKNVSYTLTGDNPNIMMIGTLLDWTIVIDRDNSQFVITAPTTLSAINRIEVAILVAVEGQSAGVYPLTLIVDRVEDGVLIDGTVWANRNLDDSYTFAATPGAFGKFYQYNINVAIAPTANLPAYTNVSTEWANANDPCPDGWRIPTTAELKALIASGWRKVDPSTDNWNVHGVWFGPDAATATSSDMGTSIFLPAAGHKYDNYDPTTYFLKTVNYWSRSPYEYSDQYIMSMWNPRPWTEDDFYLTVSINDRITNGHIAKSIRCVSK